MNLMTTMLYQNTSYHLLTVMKMVQWNTWFLMSCIPKPGDSSQKCVLRLGRSGDYQWEDGKGMLCHLSKRFNTRNEWNSVAVFNLTPCVLLQKDVLAHHADSFMHKLAMKQEYDRLDRTR